MMQLLLCLCLLLAAAPSVTADDEHGAWIDDFDEAVAIATAEGKDLFIDFTGSDWCGWCKRLDKEVFAHDEFLTAVSKDFVLVSLDYPRGKQALARVPNPKRNAELSSRHGITGFPTCLLMTVDGEVFGRTGYLKGGAANYVEDVQRLASEGRRLLGEVTALGQALATATDVLPVLEQVVAKLGTMNAQSTGLLTMAGMARQVFVEDSDDASGLKLRAIRALLAVGQVDNTLIEAAIEQDPQNVSGLFEQVVATQFGVVRDAASARAAIAGAEALIELELLHDETLVYGLVGQAAVWCEKPIGNHERALKLAQRALTRRSKLPKQLLTILDQIVS
jgi:thioredoxin-related protein